MISIDTQDIKTINALEKEINCRIIDWAIDEDSIHIVVPYNKVGSIVGKGGENIKRFNELTGKTIKVYGYSSNLRRFVNSLVQNYLEDMELKEENGQKVLYLKINKKKKPLIVGKNGRNIKIITELLRRSFNIDKIIL